MARDNRGDHLRAAAILERDRYMDDLIHSSPTPEEAVQCVEEVDTVLAAGSFKIKEWHSSSAVVRARFADVPKIKP